MKVTRFTQSCLLVEEGGTKILIDPSGDEVDNLDKFGKLHAVFYTHEHGDHFDPQLAQKFLELRTAIYANASTAKQINGQPNVVKDGQNLVLGEIQVKVIELPHCLMPDGSAGPQNTGYLINEKLFHPGDGKELESLQVDNLAWPITGPDISPLDAFKFAGQVSAKVLIPVHYDVLGANPARYQFFIDIFNFPFEMKVLQNGQSTEL